MSNHGPAGIGGIGPDCLGSVIFFFFFHKGKHSNNFIMGLAILRAIECACALGWHNIIYEFYSQVIVNFLNKRKWIDVNWKLSLVVHKILKKCSMLAVVSFTHIPHERNRVIDCLAKWALKQDEDWKIEGWGQLSLGYYHELERIIFDDLVS
jgi:ribonuclease HI